MPLRSEWQLKERKTSKMPDMRSRLFAVVVVLLLCFPTFAQSNGEAAIRKVLDDQVAAWNGHDLEGFMAGYWNSPELTFFSGGTITRGWQPTLDRYRQRYQSAGAEMGTLEFTGITIQMLGRDAAFVRGNFHLKMASGKGSSGIFTLVFRRFPHGWKIIHDHTSV